MSHPLITQHQERVAALYTTEAPGILMSLARIGVSPEIAAEAVTYAFERLARRPDIARQVEPVAWLTAVTRNRAERLQLNVERAGALPDPPADQAPDLMAALTASRQPTTRRRPGRPRTTPTTPAKTS